MKSAQAASDLLWSHWQEGRRLAALPPDLKPATRQEGYAIQAVLERRSAGPLFGWKIAATSKAGQKHIGVDGPMAGRLLAERVYSGGATLPFGANAMRVAEAEFAFRMAHDLAPRATVYEIEEVVEAVGMLHLAIEVPDSRYEDFVTAGAPQLIADNACAHDFVLGPPVAETWRGMNLAEHPVVAEVNGVLRHEGTGANVLGDPRVALTWIVNELSGIGVTLKAGQVVTTGTCVVPIPIQPGCEVVADFGRFGRVTTRFRQRPTA